MIQRSENIHPRLHHGIRGQCRIYGQGPSRPSVSLYSWGLDYSMEAVMEAKLLWHKWRSCAQRCFLGDAKL